MNFEHFTFVEFGYFCLETRYRLLILYYLHYFQIVRTGGEGLRPRGERGGGGGCARVRGLSRQARVYPPGDVQSPRRR